jgi:DhnA family fructose-bisphosphate aldolase class Ia
MMTPSEAGVRKMQEVGMSQRPSFIELGLNTGKKARLRRILFQHGAGNGTALFLPYDQGLEHGPRDFFANPAASDPKYVIRLALEGVVERGSLGAHLLHHLSSPVKCFGK